MAYLMNCIIALVLIAGAYAQDSTDLVCLQQKCHECSLAQANKPTDKVECSVRTIMGPNWFVPDATPFNTNNTLNDTVKIEFACVKFTASDPSIDGDSIIALRGCSLKSEAESLCRNLTSQAQGRNKTEVQCITCVLDQCNGSAIASAAAMMALLSFIVTIKTLF